MRKVVTAAGAVALLMGGAFAAPSSSAPRVRLSHGHGKGTETSYRTAASEMDQPVKVTIELEETPLAIQAHQAKLAGHPFDDAARQAASDRVASSQTSVAREVRLRGGSVLGSLSVATNALVAQLPQRSIEALAKMPGVARVRVVHLLETANATSDVATSTAAAWQNLGLTGTGTKIGIIDDGIDYTHADFGGAGDYASNDRTIVEPGSFPTTKVAGGYDFVGDGFDAGSSDPTARTAVPDDDPLACADHGTHVAGTAAGFGVNADGTTFAGPYDTATVGALAIGPGSAPGATLYAYKVFGCDGSTDNSIVAQAIDRAVADGVDVINISVSSAFGTADDLEAQAIDNAVQAGITVVAPAGNDGTNPYLVSAPSTATRAISVAATDTSFVAFRGAMLGTTVPVQGIVLDEVAAPNRDLRVHLLTVPSTDPAAPITISTACADSDYASVAADDLVVVERGGACTPQSKAARAEAHGAAAIVYVNDSVRFPAFVGATAGVTIPMIGVLASASADLIAADGTTITLSATADVPNGGYKLIAPFSSGGPRSGDSALKPDIAAPGVSVRSALSGSGTGSVFMSGSSMSSAHVAGIAALLRQEHPTWDAASVKAAIMNTADASLINTAQFTRTFGAGQVNALRALSTSVVVVTDDGGDAVSFGYQAATVALKVSGTVTLRNTGSVPITYSLAAVANGRINPFKGSTVTATPSTVTLQPGTDTPVVVTLDMPSDAVASLPPASQASGALQYVGGSIVATADPSTPADTLSVPFLLVPRSVADVVSQLDAPLTVDETVGAAGIASGQVDLTNNGVRPGTSDLYAWLLKDRPNDHPDSNADLRSLGVKVSDAFFIGGDPGTPALTFAINTENRWSAPSTVEFDVLVDTNDDGVTDFTVLGADEGLVLNGQPNGRMNVFVLDAAGVIVDSRQADAPMNGSTILLATPASVLGLDATHGAFSVRVVSKDLASGVTDSIAGGARFDLAHPALSSDAPTDTAPGGQTGNATSLPVTVDLAALRADNNGVGGSAGNDGNDWGDHHLHGSLGWLVVTLDNANGAAQADEVGLVFQANRCDLSAMAVDSHDVSGAISNAISADCH